MTVIAFLVVDDQSLGGGSGGSRGSGGRTTPVASHVVVVVVVVDGVGFVSGDLEGKRSKSHVSRRRGRGIRRRGR